MERLHFKKILSEALREKKEFTKNQIDFIEQLSLSTTAQEFISQKSGQFIELLNKNWEFFSDQHDLKHQVSVESHQQQLSTTIHIYHHHYPFLIDTILLYLQEHQLKPDYVFFTNVSVKRDIKGHLIDLSYKKEKAIDFSDDSVESSLLIFFQSVSLDHDTQLEVRHGIEHLLKCLLIIKRDFHHMAAKMDSLAHNVVNDRSSQEFLKWLHNNHYLFIGYDFFTPSFDQMRSTNVEFLGLLSDSELIKIQQLNKNQLTLIQHDDQECFFAKDKTISRVHRSVHYDVLYIKEYDSSGKLVCIHRFIGLLNAQAYQESIAHIPLIKHKIDHVFERLEIDQHSYEGHRVQHQLSILNKNDLYYQDVESLSSMISRHYYSHDRSEVKAYLLPNPFSDYLVFYVYVPRDIFNSSLRLKLQKILMETFCATDCLFEPYFSESSLARIRFELRGSALLFDASHQPDFENHLRDAGYLWHDRVQNALQELTSPTVSSDLFRKYIGSFSVHYQDYYHPQQTVQDMLILDQINQDNPIVLLFFKQQDQQTESFHLKLFQYQKSLSLSLVVPILENFGLTIIKNRLFELKINGNKVVWLNDFSMEINQPLKEERNIFTQAVYDELSHTFKKIFAGQMENDRFNKLIISTGMTSRQITLLRAWSKYLWQVNFPFSQPYIEEVCGSYPDLAEHMVRFFETRFDPDINLEQKNLKLKTLDYLIQSMLDSIANLDSDKILRKIYNLILAIVRTNYFQKDLVGNLKEYISFKFNPKLITDMPAPLMLHEIFVYSYDVEGVHLRSSDIARGGIRWSDRFEDYRTEILGLVKAQQVKNSIIVPSGAKGGFIVRHQAKLTSREAIAQAGIDAYKIFIRGLLDLTDNLVRGEMKHPDHTVRLDQDDPYFVVAADKGTATFSDIANSISAEYGYWLGDAFASGGSQGYDHKKIGITARGAFESIKNHFAELGISLQDTSITVIGIGDMSGDVFGNGALLLPKMKLIAAFNHLDIFIDPNPHIEAAYQERLRLFNVAKGSWSDYNSDLISEGGGVFSRKLKSITLTPQMKEVLKTNKDKMSPAELIHTLLQAPVDLIFNGGIGTYVKASIERHTDVGDRQNDLLRVDASMLRCKVFAEGGNLGVTQRARIEFSQRGGKINTDTLDNSAGVDCSDHEVNIKILLNYLAEKQSIVMPDRNALLASMTDQVAQLVLKNNTNQNYTISMLHHIAHKDIKLHQLVLQDLTNRKALERELEFLPHDEEIAVRVLNKKGLTRPELIILMSYVKMDLKAQLTQENFDSYPLIKQQLKKEFPEILLTIVGDKIFEHPLKNNIIATMTANVLVNDIGLSFVYRLRSETKASYLEIVHSAFLVREIFDNDHIIAIIRALPDSLGRDLQYDINIKLSRMFYRAIRWFIKNKKMQQSTLQDIVFIKKSVDDLRNILITRSNQLSSRDQVNTILSHSSLHQDSLKYLMTLIDLLPALDLHLLAIKEELGIEEIFHVYMKVGDILKLHSIEQAIENLAVHSEWDAWGRNNMRDDLKNYQLKITHSILKIDDDIETWMKLHKHLLNDWDQMCSHLDSTVEKTYVEIAVIIRKLERFLS